jgi:hypothetical protein
MSSDYKAWLDNEYRLWGEALRDSTVQNFKENPAVERMLGSIDPELYAGLVQVTPLIELIDSIGRNPGPISGVGLRMLWYAGKVLRLDAPSIVEIGGGAGEFYAILRALGYRGDYMIMDLPDVMKFQRDYLAEVRFQTGLRLPLTRLTQFNTCVSFYALGEFDDDTKQKYIEQVVTKCEHGFILWNPHSGAGREISFDCRVSDEYPMNHPGCKLLEW